jgi:zinc protease
MRGTKNKSRQQIQDEIDRLKAQINVSGGATSATASIETIEANLPGALRLAAEILREPAFPESEFETVRQQRIAAAEAGRSDPQALALTEFRRRLEPIRAAIPATSPPPTSRSKTSRRSRSTTSASSTSSSTAPASAKSPSPDSSTPRRSPNWPPSSSAIGRAPAATRASPTCTRRRRPPTEDRDPRQAELLLHGRQLVKLNDEDPDYPALVMANYMFGGSGLGTRLSRRIRDKEGLSYGVQSQFAAPTKDDAATSWAWPQRSAEHPQSGSQLPR